jgi:hypothetical protein
MTKITLTKDGKKYLYWKEYPITCLALEPSKKNEDGFVLSWKLVGTIKQQTQVILAKVKSK